MDLHHLTYPAIFLWFLVLEQLTPVPEEVALMSMGYVAVHTGMNPYLCGAVALTGLLITDNFLFYLGRKGSRFTRKMVARLSGKMLERIEENMKHSKVTIFVLGLIPKLRFIAPVIAGTVQVSWKYFFVINSLTTLFYVAFYMMVGIFFHEGLKEIPHEFHLLRHSVFIFLMLAVTAILSFKLGQKYLRSRHGEQHE